MCGDARSCFDVEIIGGDLLTAEIGGDVRPLPSL